jgi:TPR repeat protein
LRLGIMYFEGSGVARDYERAHTLFEQVSSAGQDAGYYWLGRLFETGLGRPRDQARARALYARAESVWAANIRLAVMSVDGKGGPRDTVYFQATLDSMADSDELRQMEELAQAFEATVDGARAHQVYERMLRMAERAGDAELTRKLLGTLADSYANYEMPLKAEPLYLRLLALKEKELGAQHAEVAGTLHELASVYADTARLSLAEPMARRALELRLATVGQAHAGTRNTLRKLAGLLAARGDLAGARQSLAEVQTWVERDLGPAHAQYPAELSRIAQAYYDLGQYEDAENLYRRSLAIVESKADAQSQLPFDRACLDPQRARWPRRSGTPVPPCGGPLRTEIWQGSSRVRRCPWRPGPAAVETGPSWRRGAGLTRSTGLARSLPGEIRQRSGARPESSGPGLGQAGQGA